MAWWSESVGFPGEPETHGSQRENRKNYGYVCVHGSPGLEGRDNANASDTSNHQKNGKFSHLKAHAGEEAPLVLLAPTGGKIPGEAHRYDKQDGKSFNHRLPPWQG